MILLGQDETEKRFYGITTDFVEFSQNSDNYGKYDIIVANPPYIPSSDLFGLQAEVRNYEDSVALDGGDDGMNLISQILNLALSLLSTEGTRELWMEVDTSHPALIIEKYNNHNSKNFHVNSASGSSKGNSYVSIEGKKDMMGNPRFVKLVAG